MGDDILTSMKFGTADPPVQSKPLAAGNFDAVVEGGALRNLQWRGVEIVRVLDFLARDESWGTFVPEESHEEIISRDDGFRYVHSFRLGDGALDCRIVLDGHADGRLVATGRAKANRRFSTCRTGFVLLHPIDGAWQARVSVTHPDGSVEQTAFPS